MKKQLSVIAALLLTSSTLSFGQGITINRDIYGINAWYIDAKGAGTSTFAATFESELNAVKASGCRYVRIGGIAPNWDQLYNFNPQNLSIITPVNRLEYLITKIREAGMDVIIQVSYNPSCPNYTLESGYNPLGPLTLQQQATVAANLVDYLNNNVFSNDPILYWIIGNEPDLSLGTCSNPRGYSMASQSDAVFVADYLKAFSIAMKNKYKHIRIIGPEVASFTTDDFGPVNEMMTALISHPAGSHSATSVMGKIPSGNAAAGEYFVDIVSFHYYPGSSNSSRASVYANPTHSTSGFAAKLNSSGISGRTGLVEMITAAGRTIYDCRIACTEFNLDNFTPRDEGTHFADVIKEWDSRSFAGGQWLCEVFAEAFKQNVNGTPWVQFMNLWSVKEGGCDESSNSKPFGYISNCGSNNLKRPMYHHYKALTTHFLGEFYSVDSPISNGTSTNTNIKAWAAKNDEKVVVLILNQNSSASSPTSIPFHVRLSNTIAAKGTGTIDIPFNIPGIYANMQYASTTTSLEIKNESTVLLTFNCKGQFGWRHDYTMSAATLTTDPGFQVIQQASPSPMIAGQISTGTTVIGIPTVQVQMSPNTFTYTWFAPVTNYTVPIENSGTTATLTLLTGTAAPTVYTYVATDANGCQMAEEIAVHDGGVVVGGGSGNGDPGIMTISPSTCGKSDGEAWMWGGSYSNTATYSWDGASAITSNSIGSLAPGGHYVTLFSSGNFISNYQFSIPVSGSRPALNAGFDRLEGKLCPVLLEAIPHVSGNTYAWYSGNSMVAFTANRFASVTNWLGETYHVKVTDVNGCVNEDYVTVSRIPDRSCLPSSWNAEIPCDNNFNSTYRQSSIPTETLTANMTISQNTFFDKILTVPEGFTLTIQNCVVAFSPSAQVIVAPGGGLDLDQVYIVNCDSAIFPFFKGTGDHSPFRVRNSAFQSGVAAFELDGDVGPEFEGNVFSRCGIGIKLNNCQQVDITQNTFYLGSKGIQSASENFEVTGVVESNNFLEIDTGIEVVEGDHTGLSVTCNTLQYNAYGILSDGTLSDFGNEFYSPGNIFISASPNINHQFYHTGNAVAYYCSPQNMLELSTGHGSVTVFPAENEPVCPEYSGAKMAMALETAQSEIHMVAFPNPTDGLLNVHLRIPHYNEMQYYLYEAASGKLIATQELRSGQDSFTIDLGTCAPGIYALLLRGPDGKHAQLKIVNTR